MSIQTLFKILVASTLLSAVSASALEAGPAPHGGPARGGYSGGHGGRGVSHPSRPVVTAPAPRRRPPTYTPAPGGYRPHAGGMPPVLTHPPVVGGYRPGGAGPVNTRVVVGPNGVPRHYVPVIWGGRQVHVYHPMVPFRPDFHVWWRTGWGYGRLHRWSWPACGEFSYYWAPFGYRAGGCAYSYRYETPWFWMTDYVFGSMLEESWAIQAERERELEWQQERNYFLAEEIRREIALEVRGEMTAIEQGYAVNPYDYFGNPSHYWVVSRVTTVGYSNGVSCVLTPGDVIRSDENSPITEGEGAAWMTVIGAKRGSCLSNTVVAVPVDDLIEYQNDMRIRVELGMQHMGDAYGVPYRQ